MRERKSLLERRIAEVRGETQGEKRPIKKGIGGGMSARRKGLGSTGMGVRAQKEGKREGGKSLPKKAGQSWSKGEEDCESSRRSQRHKVTNWKKKRKPGKEASMRAREIRRKRD